MLISYLISYIHRISPLIPILTSTIDDLFKTATEVEVTVIIEPTLVTSGNVSGGVFVSVSVNVTKGEGKSVSMSVGARVLRVHELHHITPTRYKAILDPLWLRY